jgi:methylase of polypeptide subunit release factors
LNALKYVIDKINQDIDLNVAGQTKELLSELVRNLEITGYREYYASFNPLCTCSRLWFERLKQAPSELHPVVKLFLFGQSVRLDDVKFVAENVSAFCDLGILRRVDDDRVQTTGLALIPIFGLWIFCQSASTANQTLYFGDDTMGLLSRLAPRPHGKALDLCTGPGTQALFSSLYADEVVAVDVNPVAVALARLNTEMNQRSDRVRVVCGDLYNAIDHEQFDTISANPPLLPFPDNIAYPFVGHGGADGVRITNRILAGLPQYLKEEGQAQIIGCCLSDGILPLPLEEFDEFGRENGLRILFTVTSEYRLAPGEYFFEGLVDTAANVTSVPRKEISEEFEVDLQRQKATHICAYFLQVTKKKPGVVLQDLHRDGFSGLWYAE